MATAFRDQLRALARAHKTSVERVLHDAWDPDVRGTSPAAVKKVLLGQRPLQPVQMERIAAVLKERPEVFAEYQLAQARRLLDENEVGLEQALANLEASALVPPFSAADAENPALPRAKPVPDPDETTPAQTERPARTAAGEPASAGAPRRKRAT